MQTLHITARAEEGKIIVAVPESFNGKVLDVTIQELFVDNTQERVKKFHEISVEERLKILKEFEGKAPYPDVEINKYDVYDQ